MKRTTLRMLFFVGFGAGLGFLAEAGPLGTNLASAEPRTSSLGPSANAESDAGCSEGSIRSGLLPLATAAVIPGTSSTTQGGKKPNIVIIWGDDIGQSNISAYSMGMMGYRTPNIDRVAKEGMIFTDYYAEQSCTAGRASFITGQHGLRTGLTKVGLPGSSAGPSETRPDDRRAAQAARVRHRPVRQEPPGRSQRVPSHGPRLRRVLRQPLSLERRGRARAPRLPQGPGLPPEVRPAGRARLQGDRRRTTRPLILGSARLASRPSRIPGR